MIESSTFQFLHDLSLNNNREWFNQHKNNYEKSLQNVHAFTAEIIKGLAEFDKTIPEDLHPKNCVMRIYRDIRFSKDKTPLKTNFGIAISSNGKNFKGPGYYIHIQPQQCFLAGGSWHPQGDELKAIRQEIDYNGADLHEVLEAKSFKKYFSGFDREGALKTTPKGYSADHPDIEFLKLKSFSVTHSLSNHDLEKADSTKLILKAFENLYPLMVFLRNAIS